MNNNRSFLPGNWNDKEKAFQQNSKKHEQAAKRREENRAKKAKPVENTEKGVAGDEIPNEHNPQ